EYETGCQIEASTPSLDDFLSSTALVQDRKRTESGAQRDAVNLMTIHSSKGLEFPACFLIGMEDHIIPHQRSLKEGTLSEERRLMYVAITRAKQYLTCSMAQTRKRMGKLAKSQPSRFMMDLPKNLYKATRWDAN
ncbi:MAG: ATP-dependent helicase, partial [Chlamydiia bacterium]|nr:ATP-dependent helicase [Chlamydiia bacterium]